MTWAHIVPVSCQQKLAQCERGQSLTTGSSDISPQTNNIFDQNHMMNIIHLIEQTGYHWVSCQYCACVTKMYSCKWSVWSTSCGFSGDQEMMANYLHHWFMNKWKKNDFPLLHSAAEICESSCKQSVCLTQVLQGSTNKALCTTSIQSTIKWYALYFDYMVTQPRCWLLFCSECICTLTHT